MANRLANYNYTAAETWNANYDLYSHLLANPSLNSNPFVSTYLGEMNNSNFATFYNVLNAINNTMRDESLSNQLNTLIGQRDAALENALTALQQTINDGENIVLEDAYNLAIIQYNTTEEILNVYIQNHNASRNSLLDAALSQNEGIAVNSPIETNLKLINALRIKNYKGIELNGAEWAVAEQIAQICTKDGGFPTSLARVLVSNRKNTQNTCAAYQGKVTTTTKSNHLIFYPNPATDELNITYKTNSFNNSAVEVKIYDLSGRIIATKPLNLNELNTINISELKEGFYLINLYEANRLVKADKFVKSY
jgi:hypothetical protein